MKKFLRAALPFILLSAMVSCGEDGDNENTTEEDQEDRRDVRRRRCDRRTSGEDWSEFVDNVKKLRFAEFASHSCWESSRSVKLQNCDQKGIFYRCDGIPYNRPIGGKPCSSGGVHEASLIRLVTPRPISFEAEFCDDKMVGAKIAIAGKGKEYDQYHFNFERPASYNPVFKKVWRDTGRRFLITVRQ